MDLLFKNPKYFIETYFSIPFWLFGAIFVVIFAFTCLYDWIKGTWKSARVLWRLTWSLCVTIILGTCLFNQSRPITRKLVLNPLPGIKMVCQGNIHWIRQVTSNFILYLPIGVVLRIRIKAIYTVLVCFVLSLFVEVLQYAFSVGTTETMDIIINTFGAIIGAGIIEIYRILKDKWLTFKRFI